MNLPRKAFAALMMTAAAAVLAGCPTGNAVIPGTNIGASTGPNTNASAAPGTTPTMAPSTTPTCSRTVSPDADTGVAAQGEYLNQRLPDGYAAAYTTEAGVTEAIGKVYGTPDWVCFQSFYPGATGIYLRKTGKAS